MSGDAFNQPLPLLLCPLKKILSSTTLTAVLSKIPITLLSFLFTVSHFIPVCNVCASLGVWVLYITWLPNVFKQILPLASSHSLCVICVSRRKYEGSTPYSVDELKTIHHVSEAERADLLHNEGILIALFVDELIQSLSLPKKGGVTVVGWSLGNLYTIAMRASINDLPDNSKQRLKEYMWGFVILDLSLHCSMWSTSYLNQYSFSLVI